ncbi:hypothetical protein J6590_019135 [Homalodisca vitripennis]|nr:hypothetical protein J6590_019135 [Homalodisca vitripennis]
MFDKRCLPVASVDASRNKIFPGRGEQCRHLCLDSMFALRATTGKLCVVSLCEFLVRNRSIVVFSVSELLLFVFPIRLDFWTQDNVISLIQLYELHRLLWDTNEPNYKNKYKRKDSYTSIAKELGVNNTEEVKKKIESLLVQFRREKKAVIPKSGMGTADKKKAWWGLQFFQFLSDKNVPRQTVSSKTQDEVSEDLLSENEDLLSSAGPSRTSTPFSSASLFSGTSNSSVSSKPVAKRGNKRKLVDEAFNIMTTCFNEMLQEPKPTKDEHTVYGECVANRIRKIKNHMRLCIVKNKIDNILFEAEMEEYKDVSEKPEQNKTSEQPGTFEKPVEEEDIGNISSLIASSMNTVSGYFEDL